MSRMPVLFFGHGSPMIALETNDITQSWVATVAHVERAYGRPRSILCVSAHWVTRGIAVTAMANPPTIHDFGGFPPALSEVRYPGPGDPSLAARIAELLAPHPVVLDEGEDRDSWGFDHGTWTVLCKAYPQADIPVVQLSMDGSRDTAFHYGIGRRLRPLRDEGVLIIGTGNIVHNLRQMNVRSRNAPPHVWARRFNDHIRGAIKDDQPERAVAFATLGQDAQDSVPTPEHYWPLLYVLGARDAGDRPAFGPGHIEHGSLGMTSFMLPPMLPLAA